MARNSNLILAAMACLDGRALNAAVQAGTLSKSDIRTIHGLRANGGRSSGDIAKSRLTAAIHKQFADRDRTLSKARTLIEDYARKRVQEVMPMPTLVEQNVAKAADTQAALHEAIIGYQASHPGCRRADAIDAVLLSPQVGELHKAERRVMELQKAKNTLPQPRSTADIDFSSPLRGTPGYGRTKDARPPHNPDSGENPIIRDHHQVLDDIKSGKLLWNIPRSRRWLRSNASASSRTTDICRSEQAARGGAPVVRRDAASGEGASRLLQWARWLAVQIPFCGLHVAARVKLVLHGGDCTRNGVN